MKLPNADNAIIAADKLREYLLNFQHRRGSNKARVLTAMGYDQNNWSKLEADVRRDLLPQDVREEVNSDYGQRYEIVAPLTGPNGRIVVFRSIWQIDIGTDRPRLITMYPE